MGKNFVRIADLNNNFSGFADPINVMDSDLGKTIVQITDSKHNCSRTADLSMAASTDLALKLRGSADSVPPPLSSPPLLDCKVCEQLHILNGKCWAQLLFLKKNALQPTRFVSLMNQIKYWFNGTLFK